MAQFTLDLEETLRLLDEAVEERGEGFTYRKPAGFSYCAYFHPDGQPGCIVGWVLAKKGAKPEDFEGESQYGGHALNQTGVDDLIRSEVIVTDDGDVEALLIAVQESQDQGDNWGTAVDQGRQCLAERAVE